MICLSTSRSKKQPNFCIYNLSIKIHNLFNRLKISIHRLLEDLNLDPSPLNFIFRKKLFRFSKVETLSFKSWELSVLFSSQNYPPQRKPCSIHPSVGTPQCPSSSAIQPALRLHFGLFMGTRTDPLVCWDFGVKLGLGVCVCVCVYVALCLVVFLLQPLPSVGVFSICLGTTDCQQQRLFVQFSAKNGFKCYLAAPLWGDHNDDRHEPLTHASRLPSRADKIKYEEAASGPGTCSVRSAQSWCSTPVCLLRATGVARLPAPRFDPSWWGPAWVSGEAWGCISDTERRA